MEANPLYVNKPVNLFGYTPVWIEGKNPRGYIPQSPRYFPLWEMRIFRQREMCSMSPATFSLLSFTHRKGEQPSMMLFSPTFSGAPNSSNTLVLTPLFSDQIGKKVSHYSGSIFTISVSHLAWC